MFKAAARWRSEKNKIKAVFKLQFKATQVPSLGWEAMVVTLVPMDVGKATARSEKATVINGTCHWLSPIYETVKLTQDAKTGKIHDKVYQFLVSATGSAKSGVLGEITINLADYTEIFKPSSVSIPLQATNSGAILHVTLQRMQGDVEGRETDVNGDIAVKQHRRTLMAQLSNNENEEGSRFRNGENHIHSNEDGPFLNSQQPVKFHSTRNMPLRADSGTNLRKSSSFDAISASGSESSSGQYTPRGNEIKNNSHRDSGSLLSPLSNSDTPRNPSISLGTDWSVGSAPDGSIGGSSNSSGETQLRERIQESHNPLEKQKSDAASLARQLELTELELQALRKQVAKESRRGQDLSRELSILKEERDSFRKECEELKASKKRIIEDKYFSTKLQFGAKDPWSMLEEMKEELDHEKNLNANLRLQLQKTQESNSELIFAVRDLEELLENKDKDMSCTNEDTQDLKLGNHFSQESVEETSDHEEEQYALDVLVKEHDDVKVAYSLEQNIVDLNNELEFYKKDREDLEIQIEQLALDYEILRQENHNISSRLEQTQLREQLRMQYECSAHLAIISDLEAHVENLEKELEKQAEAFEASLATVMCEKVEQEKRAIQAEEMSKKTRWENVNTAEYLQEEFKRLSAQMSTTFYANEKVVMKALTETRELRLQKCHLEELLDKTEEEISSVQHQHQVKCQQLLSLIDFKTKEADRLYLELKDEREELGNQKKSEEARQKASREEMSALRAEIEQLLQDKSQLSEQIEQNEKLITEMEKLKTSAKEIEMLLQEKSMERDTLQKELNIIKEEAKKSLEDLNDLRHLKHEQDVTIKTLHSEVAALKAQYSDLQLSLFDDELRRDNSRKENNKKLMRKDKSSTLPPHASQEVVQENTESLETNLIHQNTRHMHERRKDMTTIFGQSGITHVQEDCSKNFQGDNTNGVKTIEDYLHETNRNLGANLEGEEETLAPSTCGQQKIAEILSQVEQLKEQNESMEAELKEMQERYSEISLKFAEVEGERQQLVITVRTLKNALKN